ncbi:hypothetical protein VKT23_018717 [Stygiomarasmius scandens]|uniref:EthD domain-containing protein n=1 Tax=Marasmiellus scandens TaxID=2682957 RepID=A0ABR1IQL5_9AGAR
MSDATTSEIKPATIRSDRVAALILIYKRKGMSNEEFEKYWLEEHSRVVQSVDYVQRHILKYEQLHINPQMKALIQSMGGQMPDWDGAVIAEADSHETLMNFAKDKGYETTIKPDEEKFLDRQRVIMVPMDLATVISK